MEPKQGMLGCGVSLIIVIAALSYIGSSASGATLTPSDLPGGATPGGAQPLLEKIPKIEKKTTPEVPSLTPEKLPAFPESGVRMVVKAFVLEGVIDHPERGIRKEDIDRKIEEIRLTRPKGFTISELQEVTDQITNVYRSAGYILARAYIPEQEVTDGHVVIKVLEGKLEQVTFQNNHDYSEKTLAKPFKTLIDQPVNKDEVESALLKLSDYPGLKFNSVFSPGETIGTAKLGINIDDEKKTEGTVWFDNYGTKYTGEYRFWLDAALNNPTGAADRLSTQLLTSFGDKSGNSDYYALSYQRPVFDPGNLFSIDVNKNSFKVGGIFSDLDLVGESTAISTSLRKKFIRSKQMNIEGLLTLASKKSSTDISGSNLGQDALTVATMGSSVDYRDSWSGYTQLSLNYSQGLPGVLGAMNKDGDGTSSRTDATGVHVGGDFKKINLYLARWQSLYFSPQLINQTLLVRMQAQTTNDMLVSMEQMSLGGPTSVRAYPSSEYLVDKGYFMSLEWIAKSREAAKGKLFEDLQFSVFYDYATGELNNPLVNDVKTPKLKGAGISMQITPQQKYLARLEISKPLGGPNPSNDRSIQYFFKLGYLF